jgi:hypothetical protein
VGVGRLRAWLQAVRARRARFEVWAAPVDGRPFLLEACGLTRRAALAVAEEHLRRRPPVPVLVVVDAGTLVYPVRRRDADWR